MMKVNTCERIYTGLPYDAAYRASMNAEQLAHMLRTVQQQAQLRAG